MNGRYRCTSRNESMLTDYAAVPLDIHGGFIVKKIKSNHTFLIRFPDLFTLTRGPNSKINIK